MIVHPVITSVKKFTQNGPLRISLKIILNILEMCSFFCPAIHSANGRFGWVSKYYLFTDCSHRKYQSVNAIKYHLLVPGKPGGALGDGLELLCQSSKAISVGISQRHFNGFCGIHWNFQCCSELHRSSIFILSNLPRSSANFGTSERSVDFLAKYRLVNIVY